VVNLTDRLCSLPKGHAVLKKIGGKPKVIALTEHGSVKQLISKQDVAKLGRFCREFVQVSEMQRKLEELPDWSGNLAKQLDAEQWPEAVWMDCRLGKRRFVYVQNAFLAIAKEVLTKFVEKKGFFAFLKKHPTWGVRNRPFGKKLRYHPEDLQTLKEEVTRYNRVLNTLCQAREEQPYRAAVVEALNAHLVHPTEHLLARTARANYLRLLELCGKPSHARVQYVNGVIRKLLENVPALAPSEGAPAVTAKSESEPKDERAERLGMAITALKQLLRTEEEQPVVKEFASAGLDRLAEHIERRGQRRSRKGLPRPPRLE